jgi:glycine dehydrogenase subunit 1
MAKVHPYIPNSVPEVQAEMLEEIGVPDIEELYQSIPQELQLKGELQIPKPLTSEAALRQHVLGILSGNKDSEEYISFLGGGAAQHYVPAVCDEINQRSEFLTAYAGEPFEDHGRFQALWEYQSLMAELLDVEVVNVPTFDWCQAASTSIRMAERITQRSTALVADSIGPDRLAVIQNYCQPAMEIVMIKHNPVTGMLDIDDLASKLNDRVACLYFENPTYLGIIETEGEELSRLLHKEGALMIVGADPISLGVLKPPAQYGTDITCGDIQPLGMHLNFGGGLGGFIGTRDEERFVREYPSRLFGITRTIVPGEYGFGDVLYERTSFADREHGKEFVGTAAALWGITAGVYLALMGPQGMQEVGEHLLKKARFTANKLNQLAGVKAPYFKGAIFKEFVVNFNDTGKSVEEINRALLKEGIFGGHDLSNSFPELGQCALFCITEMVTLEEIEKMVAVLGHFLVKS